MICTLGRRCRSGSSPPEATPAPDSRDYHQLPHPIGEILDDIANATAAAKSRSHDDDDDDDGDKDKDHYHHSGGGGGVIKKRQNTITHTHVDVSTLTRTWTYTSDEVTQTETTTETTTVATQTVLTTVTLGSSAGRSVVVPAGGGDVSMMAAGVGGYILMLWFITVVWRIWRV